ncbi:hypothetical protein ES703_59559 [subsurface metagenome]
MIDQDIITSCEEQKAKWGYAPNPSCAVCRGSGNVHPLLDSGKPDYARVIPCQAEGCIADQKKVYESTSAYIKEKGVSKFNTFDSFKPVLGAETTVAAFKDIALNRGAPPLLLVYGTTGNGKTHLCEAAVIVLLGRGINTRLWSVPDLVSKLHESIPENTTELIMDGLKKIPALVLDEWGQNYGSKWEEQKLEEIVIARERDGLITIIATNLEPDQFPERIMSRFRDAVDARAILNKAPDYRPEKKAKKGLVA